MVIIPKYIEKLIPYVPGKTKEEIAQQFSLDTIAKLASNENPFGPSPKALQALQNNFEYSHLYPDPSSGHLTEALSKHLGVPSENIVCAHGIDAILGYVLMAFTRREDEIVTSEKTFIGMRVHARKMNRKMIEVPMNDWTYDLDALATAINSKTKIIYLANPNNPTGTAFTKKQLESFLEKVPEKILIVLDEAYFEYAQSFEDYPNGIEQKHPNLIVTRTFSKAYGLAGLRVGYAVAHPDIILQLKKVKLPFEPARICQYAALAALEDTAFVEKTLTTNREGLKQFTKIFDEKNIAYAKNSKANFIMMHFKTEEIAQKVNTAFTQKGLIVRPLQAFDIPTALRISTGSSKDMEFAINIINETFSEKGLT